MSGIATHLVTIIRFPTSWEIQYNWMYYKSWSFECSESWCQLRGSGCLLNVFILHWMLLMPMSVNFWMPFLSLIVCLVITWLWQSCPNRISFLHSQDDLRLLTIKGGICQSILWAVGPVWIGRRFISCPYRRIAPVERHITWRDVTTLDPAVWYWLILWCDWAIRARHAEGGPPWI
jgi:hypothetical protein